MDVTRLPLNEQGWLIAKASVRGKSHVDTNVPCQDYCDVETSADGRWLVAAVSDGAGSASRAEEGARIVVQAVVRGLIGQVSKMEQRGPGAWLKDQVHAILISAREKLLEEGGSIHDFNCTLVGAVIAPTGGFFFHVGDGGALGGVVSYDETGSAEQGSLKLWTKMVVSEPENGEFANETFFVTQDDWDKHLRSRPLSEGVDIVVLMSDGAMPFVLQKQRPYSPFIDPMVGLLLKVPEADERDALVHGYLADPETYAVTSDDKTLLIAMRKRLTHLADYKIIPSFDESPEVNAGKPVEQARTVPNKRRVEETSRKGSVSLPPKEHSRATDNRRMWVAIILSIVASVLALASGTLSTLVYIDRHRQVPPNTQTGQPGGRGNPAETLTPPGAEQGGVDAAKH